METIWHGVVKPKPASKITQWTYTDQNITLEKGEEMGRFLLGSTVVLLFRQRVIGFSADWAADKLVRLGETMGNRPSF
jgi:phosphatidylserine decarboxylase